MKLIIATGTRGNDIYYGLAQFMAEQVRRYNAEIIFGVCSWSAIKAQENIERELQTRDYDYVLMVDADVAPPMDALEKLTSLNLDIVGVPVWMAADDDVHMNIQKISTPARIRAVEPAGVEEVVHVSFACILVHKRVWDTFRARGESPFHASPLAGENRGAVPDLVFNDKARAMGFKVHICWDVKGTIHHRPLRLHAGLLGHIKNHVGNYE